MPSIPAVPQLLARHLGHNHTANLKYGYIILFIDIVYPLYLWATRYYYHKRWSQTGRSTSYIRLVLVPLPVKIILWTCIIVLLGFWNLHTGLEFTIHIKRFGRMSYVLLPLDIFLSYKPSPLPLNNYLDLLTLHKWLSRLIIVCAFFHSIGYLVKWSIEGGLNKSGKILNLLGIICFGFYSVLFLISIRPVRRFLYKFFYLFHMITVWLTVFLIAWHARPGVSFYTVLCVALLCYQIGHRVKSSIAVDKIRVKRPDGASLSLITLPRDLLPTVFSPASHIRLSHKLLNPKSWLFATHPYTIASSPRDTELKLIVRESGFQIDPLHDYSMTGPFNSIPINFYQTAENVCIICSGSGISFALPIYNHFKKTSMDFISIKLVWVNRNKNDLYLLKDLKIKGIEIYISQDHQNPIEEQAHDSELEQFLIKDSDSDIDMRDSLDSFDLQLNPFNDPKNVVDSNSNMMDKNLIHYGRRPNLDSCFKKQLSKTADNANKWVIACGKKSLINDAKKFASKNGARFLAEEYSM